MSANKPSDAEDEYFKKQDLERLQRMRTKLDKVRESQRAEQQKHEHWMRCPKCGSAMDETLFRHIMVDRCPNCGFIGFDAGELDMLLGNGTEETILSRFGNELKRLFTIGGMEKDD